MMKDVARTSAAYADRALKNNGKTLCSVKRSRNHKRLMCLITALFISLVYLCLPAQAQARTTDLLGVYQEALHSDPTFEAARENWMAIKENIPIAASALLPHFDITGSVTRIRNNDADSSPFSSGSVNYYHGVSTFKLSLSQAFFNYSAWMQVKSAKASVKQSVATLSAAAQDLMLRTAQAYFNVLQAYDDMRYTRAEKRSLARQLKETQARFQVGLVPVTDVDQARARYQLVAANLIAAANELANRLEELRAITKCDYRTLLGLKSRLLLLGPRPNRIERWVQVALRQNYQLRAAYYRAQSAKENIHVQASGRWPVVSGVAAYSEFRDTNRGSFGLFNSLQGSIAAELSVPLVQGGAVLSKTRQAVYQYRQALADQERVEREIVADARKAYLGVISGISQIKAQAQAIASNQSALRSVRAAYQAGTRTITDVLIAQTALYNAQRNYARSQYDYLINRLRLKRAAGLLSVDDLRHINERLAKRVPVKTYRHYVRGSSTTSIRPVKQRRRPVKPNRSMTHQMRPHPIILPRPFKGPLHAEFRRAVTRKK